MRFDSRGESEVIRHRRPEEKSNRCFFNTKHFPIAELIIVIVMLCIFCRKIAFFCLIAEEIRESVLDIFFCYFSLLKKQFARSCWKIEIENVLFVCSSRWLVKNTLFICPFQ